MRVVARAEDFAAAPKAHEERRRLHSATVACSTRGVSPRSSTSSCRSSVILPGNVVHIFERKCSIQRRHQKLVEEAPATGLGASCARRWGRRPFASRAAIGYSNAGTIEFLLDQPGKFYFLEIDARLQVEHPVTGWSPGSIWSSGSSGWQPANTLRLTQDRSPVSGHAIEARLYAENPEDAVSCRPPARSPISAWQPQTRRSGSRAGWRIQRPRSPVL